MMLECNEDDARCNGRCGRRRYNRRKPKENRYTAMQSFRSAALLISRTCNTLMSGCISLTAAFCLAAAALAASGVHYLAHIVACTAFVTEQRAAQVIDTVNRKVEEYEMEEARRRNGQCCCT